MKRCPNPGRFDEAITEIKTAIDLDPAAYYHQATYRIVLTYARRYDEAAQQLERLVPHSRTNFDVAGSVGRKSGLEDRSRTALPTLKRAQTSNPIRRRPRVAIGTVRQYINGWMKHLAQLRMSETTGYYYQATSPAYRGW